MPLVKFNRDCTWLNIPCKQQAPTATNNMAGKKGTQQVERLRAHVGLQTRPATTEKPLLWDHHSVHLTTKFYTEV
jgi:hypothetical protein